MKSMRWMIAHTDSDEDTEMDEHTHGRSDEGNAADECAQEGSG